MTYTHSFPLFIQKATLVLFFVNDNCLQLSKPFLLKKFVFSVSISIDLPLSLGLMCLERGYGLIYIYFISVPFESIAFCTNALGSLCCSAFYRAYMNQPLSVNMMIIKVIYCSKRPFDENDFCHNVRSFVPSPSFT